MLKSESSSCESAKKYKLILFTEIYCRIFWKITETFTVMASSSAGQVQLLCQSPVSTANTKPSYARNKIAAQN
jgi:hypothetical protein